MNRMAYSRVKYRRKPFVKIKTVPLWRYVYNVGVLRGNNQNYSTKLIEISLVDKINDFESNHVLNLIF